MRKKPIGHEGSYGGHHADRKRHKAHDGKHGSRPGSHSGGHKARHHDGVKSAHSGRKPKKRSNKENERITARMNSIEKRLAKEPM